MLRSTSALIVGPSLLEQRPGRVTWKVESVRVRIGAKSHLRKSENILHLRQLEESILRVLKKDSLELGQLREIDSRPREYGLVEFGYTLFDQTCASGITVHDIGIIFATRQVQSSTRTHDSYTNCTVVYLPEIA